MMPILFKIPRSHGKLGALAPVWVFSEAENVRRPRNKSKPNSHLLICQPSAEDKTTNHTYKTVLEWSQEGDKEFKVFA